MLKATVSLILVIAVALLIFVKIHSAQDIPVEKLKPRWASSASSFVNIDGLTLHIRDEGPKNDKTPVVLVHGTGASLHTWDGWVSGLKSKRRVIRFDLPGFGLTGPEPQNNYTIEKYTDYLVNLLDHLGIAHAIVAGNSLGGYLGWATAIRYPNRVSKLVLVDASGYPYKAESVPIAFKLSQNKFASMFLKDFIPKFVVRSSVENVYGDPSLVSDELVDRYYELALREGNRTAISKRFVQTQPGKLRYELNTLSVPTLLIWGGKDKLIPLEMGKQFNRDIPNSTLVVFEELGHVPHEENPDATLSTVLAFL
jgi:pimeloyl-ACP methyl ester carboxylesterase